jgi:uncharacterized membrane protein (DUF485 family)
VKQATWHLHAARVMLIVEAAARSRRSRGEDLNMTALTTSGQSGPSASRTGARVEDIVALPAFGELVRGRRVLRLTVTAIFVVWAGSFVLVTAFAPEVTRTMLGSISIAYLWGLSQIVLVWALTWFYLRHSDRVLAPLAALVLTEARFHATSRHQG